MEIIGIICEYNPFHNGHLYHLNKIKEMYPKSIIILVLNGYFLERGEISILTKEDKTKISLENGVDIVLELPFIYGTQSADTFADISVKILNNFHVNKLVFGSESNDIPLLTKIAKLQMTSDYNKLVKEYLSTGTNYPTALAKALNIEFDFNPNDLLGISYIKSIIKNNYSITPVSIKRTNDYHNKESFDSIISASNVREKINKGIEITPYVPVSVIKAIQMPNYETLFKLIKYKITTSCNLDEYLDVDEGIENRLQECISSSKSFSEFIQNIKTKRYTYNKLNRMLIHILIGFKKEDNYKNIDYIKVLGFNKKGQEYLNTIKDKLVIPTTINKSSTIYQYELKASIIYDLINNSNTQEFEQRNKPIIND